VFADRFGSEEESTSASIPEAGTRHADYSSRYAIIVSSEVISSEFTNGVTMFGLGILSV